VKEKVVDLGSQITDYFKGEKADLDKPGMEPKETDMKDPNIKESEK